MGNARAYWRTAEDLLTHLAENRIEVSTGDFADTLSFLSLQAGYLAVGIVPEPASDVAARGKPGVGPSESRDKRIAVAYRRACEPSGLPLNGCIIRVQDHKPMQTLADWYGVTEGALRRWCRSLKPDLPWGTGIDLTGEDLTDLTEAAGKSYFDQRSRGNDRRSQKHQAVSKNPL